MRYSKIIVTIGILAAMMIAAVAVAQDEMTGEGMPEMGPPTEIQDLGYMVGTWDVDMMTKWEPTDTAWMPMKGTAKYEYAAGGGALMMTFNSEFMGMPFVGTMLMTYDRETKKWQSIWVDNMSGRISYSDGAKTADGKTVMEGKDIYQGQTYGSRTTVYNDDKTSFDWKMENSYDGKTWVTTATAKYTKRPQPKQ